MFLHGVWATWLRSRIGCRGLRYHWEDKVFPFTATYISYRMPKLSSKSQKSKSFLTFFHKDSIPQAGKSVIYTSKPRLEIDFLDIIQPIFHMKQLCPDSCHQFNGAPPWTEIPAKLPAIQWPHSIWNILSFNRAKPESSWKLIGFSETHDPHWANAIGHPAAHRGWTPLHQSYIQKLFLSLQAVSDLISLSTLALKHEQKVWLKINFWVIKKSLTFILHPTVCNL